MALAIKFSLKQTLLKYYVDLRELLFEQRFILFENVSCETQEHDLQFIENQIYRNITK